MLYQGRVLEAVHGAASTFSLPWIPWIPWMAEGPDRAAKNSSSGQKPRAPTSLKERPHQPENAKSNCEVRIVSRLSSWRPCLSSPLRVMTGRGGHLCNPLCYDREGPCLLVGVGRPVSSFSFLGWLGWLGDQKERPKSKSRSASVKQGKKLDRGASELCRQSSCGLTLALDGRPSHPRKEKLDTGRPAPTTKHGDVSPVLEIRCGVSLTCITATTLRGRRRYGRPRRNQVTVARRTCRSGHVLM